MKKLFVIAMIVLAFVISSATPAQAHYPPRTRTVTVGSSILKTNFQLRAHEAGRNNQLLQICVGGRGYTGFSYIARAYDRNRKLVDLEYRKTRVYKGHCQDIVLLGRNIRLNTVRINVVGDGMGMSKTYSIAPRHHGRL